MTGLTVDEVAALHRLTGAWLPAFVAELDALDPRVDAAALRGLAARGLVTLASTATDGPVLDNKLTGLLAPLIRPRVVVDIEVEAGGALARHGVACGAAGAVGVLSEGVAGLVRAGVGAEALTDVVARLGDFGAVPAADGARLVVDGDAYAYADELVGRGEAERAVGVLVTGGARERVARQWVGTLAGRRGGGALTVAHRRGSAVASGELIWLVDAEGAAWRIEADTKVEQSTEDWEGGGELVTVCAPLAAGALGRLVGELLEGGSDDQ